MIIPAKFEAVEADAIEAVNTKGVHDSFIAGLLAAARRDLADTQTGGRSRRQNTRISADFR